MLSQFGEDDPREGSRSNGHDGVDHNDWVDHAEVPVDVLARIADALAARQTVGQETVMYRVRCQLHPRWREVDATQFTEYTSHGWEGQELYATSPAQLADSQPAGEPHAVELTCDHDGWKIEPWDAFGLPTVGKKVTVYAAPPAQAVELGQFRRYVVLHREFALEELRKHKRNGIFAKELAGRFQNDVDDCNRLLALIDSQIKKD